MAFSATLLGLFGRICPGKFDFRSLCIQTTLVDFLNLLLVVVFYVALLIGLVRRKNVFAWKRDLTIRAISICCAIIGIAYFSSGFFSSLSWLASLSRGVIWITMSLSSLLKGSRWSKILISAWWIGFFLLMSALNIEVLVKNHSIQIHEVVSWFVNFLLLFCAFRHIYSLTISRPTSENGFLEPLLPQQDGQKCCDIGHANIFGKLSFSWINPLLRLGNSKPLSLEDIPSLGAEDEAALAYEKFAGAWSSLQTGKKDNSNAESQYRALQAVLNVYWKEMVLAGIIVFLRVVALSASPVLLFAFVNYSNSESRNLDEGLFLVGGLVLVKIVDSLSYRHFFFYSRRIGTRIRSALMVAAYQKLLKLSSLGRGRHSTGEVVNYIAVDAYRMGEFVMWFHIGWSSCLQVFIAIAVLFGVAGLGVLLGLVPLIICGVLNIPFAKVMHKCQCEFMAAQDKRLRSTSEILNNMKIIKLQSWEAKFKSFIESYRESELKWLAESQYCRTYKSALYWMSPTIVSSVIFFGCVLFNSSSFNASTIFTILAALRIMSEPVRLIPEALSFLIQFKVSFERINSFLQEDEIKQKDTMRTPIGDTNLSIRIQDGHFSWDPYSGAETIRNVNLEVQKGKKVAVCGPVGAGKSSLLYAILGEIPKKSGTVNVYGSIAYVSQASWIQSGTIRDNILSGKPMDKIRYEEAIKVTALDKDIEGFDFGDLTEIGQRGLNMSGGQKQRIQLARAVYCDADIYLLDDPFSAVDAHTSASLFNDCVMSALAQKTVILLTHQVEFLSEVDHILVMESGNVTQSGSYIELLTAGTAFEQLVVAHRESMTLSDTLNEKNERKPEGHHRDEMQKIKQPYLGKENSEGDISITPGVQLTSEEEKEIGDVGLKPFLDYIFVSKGFCFLFSNIASQAGFVALQAAASYWLAFAIQSPKFSSVMIVSVYTVISTLSAFFVYLRYLFATLLGLRASKAFFTGFTNSIFKAPMLFFDSTPVGRLLTRASSDLSVLDYDIPFSYAFVMASGTELVAIIGIMASVTWEVLIVGIIAIVASKYVQGHYQPTARELMRINGTTKAPIMTYAAETALGVATIRAFKMEDRFFKNYLKLVDTDAKVFFFSNAAMEWLVLRTENLQNLTLFTAAFLLVLLPKGYLAPGLVGLSLSYAFALTGTQAFLTRWYSSLVNYIISVERIKQFMHIPPEPPAVIEEKRPPSSWPFEGRIEMKDLMIRYRPNAPMVLKGINCTFREGTRVGVVGRTGSGKTTLISALFRLVDPCGGKIIIDGIDICSIGLKDLRLKLSIIPQEPTLFRGNIRTNLDPLGLYTDEKLWKALEKCQLKDTVSKLPNLLESSVSDEGENWSMGQRQLFCLGRVLLRRNKILVLDEATASIDSATDAVLQKVIREEFSNCTVITVAHRVPTVIDSDMVMVLSSGRILEYDEPSKLMETKSAFSKLVSEYWASCRKGSSQILENY